MDRVAVCRVSRLPATHRRTGRIQRQVHVQSAGPARRLMRYAGGSCASNVSQFLLPTGALAIHGRASGAGPLVCWSQAAEALSTRPAKGVTFAGLIPTGLAVHMSRGSSMAKHPNTVPANRADALTADVLEGLKKEPKELSPVWFYDELGSFLFDNICELP